MNKYCLCGDAPKAKQEIAEDMLFEVFGISLDSLPLKKVTPLRVPLKHGRSCSPLRNYFSKANYLCEKVDVKRD